VRDKYKKEYDHYLKKTAKMKEKREVKKAKNPLETAKDVEWYQRNDRKLETARSNLISLSQESYMSVKKCMKLRCEYMMPMLETFSGSVVKFFNEANNAVMKLSGITEEIERGRQLQQEKEAEEKIRELEIEKERLKQFQEKRNRIEREKREKEQQEEERLKKELEERRYEYESKYSSSSSKTPTENSPQSRKAQEKDSYIESDIKFNKEYFKPIKRDFDTKQVKSQYKNSYSPEQPYENESQSYYEQVEPTYEQPSAGYYEQARKKQYEQARPRVDSRHMGGRVASNPFCPQKPDFSPSKTNTWGITQPTTHFQTEYPPQTATSNEEYDPFAEMFAESKPTYQEPSGVKRPRNPFMTGYTRPTMQYDQFDFL